MLWVHDHDVLSKIVRIVRDFRGFRHSTCGDPVPAAVLACQMPVVPLQK